MDTRSGRGRVSRRDFLIATAFALGATEVSRQRLRAEEVPTPVITGDCHPEPGVQLLAEWNLGLPVLSPIELLPPLTWVRYLHPTSPVSFLYPPDWIPIALWAESLSPTGMPVWLDQPVALPQLTAHRIVSPTGDAAFEFVSGTVTGMALSPAQAAWVAEQGIMGEQAELTPLCTFEYAHPLLPSWFHGMHTGDRVLVTEGYPLPQTGLFGDSTILNYYSMAGPQANFETLMRTVYIPILAQLSGGGGESEPTPTP